MSVRQSMEESLPSQFLSGVRCLASLVEFVRESTVLMVVAVRRRLVSVRAVDVVCCWTWQE